MTTAYKKVIHGLTVRISLTRGAAHPASLVFASRDLAEWGGRDTALVLHGESGLLFPMKRRGYVYQACSYDKNVFYVAVGQAPV